MKNLMMRFANWLFSKKTVVSTITSERDRSIMMIVLMRDQYRKFGMFSPDLQIEVNNLIDEIRGGIGKITEDEIKRRFDISIEELDIVPRRDYEAIRAANQNLMMLVASYQGKIADEEEENKEESPEA